MSDDNLAYPVRHGFFNLIWAHLIPPFTRVKLGGGGRRDDAPYEGMRFHAESAPRKTSLSSVGLRIEQSTSHGIPPGELTQFAREPR
jgi:hypothetical protein